MAKKKTAAEIAAEKKAAQEKKNKEFKDSLKKNNEGIYKGLTSNEVKVKFHKNVLHNETLYEAGKEYSFEAAELALIKNNKTFKPVEE